MKEIFEALKKNIAFFVYFAIFLFIMISAVTFFGTATKDVNDSLEDSSNIVQSYFI